MVETPTIYTIGYEGGNLEDFLATLKYLGIERIIDVRDRPISRKPGFSKNVLAEALAKKKIAYIHLKALGDPKEGREAARLGKIEVFKSIFQKQLKKKDAQDALIIAAKLIEERVSCLLCFERQPEYCHRTMVAEAISVQTGFPVRACGVQKGLKGKRKAHYDCAPDRELALR